jgi:hypothetical protein
MWVQGVGLLHQSPSGAQVAVLQRLPSAWEQQQVLHDELHYSALYYTFAHADVLLRCSIDCLADALNDVMCWCTALMC